MLCANRIGFLIKSVPRCGGCRTSVPTFAYEVSAIARIQFGVTSSVREAEWCWRFILELSKKQTGKVTPTRMVGHENR